ncbi:MAG: ATPase [Peptostreptococcaceae bacterium]|nr:ATPase [Peptostreptococcaceae bacterium]
MKIIVLLCTLVIGSTIGLGFYYCTQPGIKEANKKLKIFLGANISLFGAIIVVGTIAALSGTAQAAPIATASVPSASDSSGLGFIAAALSTGLATIGAGYAVGSVGSSALGAVSENPKILGKTLIFVGLAEGIAIYGLIVSILILGRI